MAIDFERKILVGTDVEFLLRNGEAVPVFDESLDDLIIKGILDYNRLAPISQTVNVHHYRFIVFLQEKKVSGSGREIAEFLLSKMLPTFGEFTIDRARFELEEGNAQFPDEIYSNPLLLQAARAMIGL